MFVAFQQNQNVRIIARDYTRNILLHSLTASTCISNNMLFVQNYSLLSQVTQSHYLDTCYEILFALPWKKNWIKMVFLLVFFMNYHSNFFAAPLLLNIAFLKMMLIALIYSNWTGRNEFFCIECYPQFTSYLIWNDEI